VSTALEDALDFERPLREKEERRREAARTKRAEKKLANARSLIMEADLAEWVAARCGHLQPLSEVEWDDDDPWAPNEAMHAAIGAHVAALLGLPADWTTDRWWES